MLDYDFMQNAFAAATIIAIVSGAVSAWGCSASAWHSVTWRSASCWLCRSASAVTSVSLTSDAPLDRERFNGWIGAVLGEKGQELLRTKGILHFADDDKRFACQAVRMIADGDYVGAWKAGDPRQSRIVFIGRELNRPELRRGFEACACR